MAKHNITTLESDWIEYLNDRSANPMANKTKKPQASGNAAFEYCFVCSCKLGDAIGRVLLRPLKDSGERSAIPPADRRVTMCANDARVSVAAGTYEIVDEGPVRITG